MVSIVVPVAIYVPTLPHPDQYLCSEHCIRRRYHVHAITNEPHDIAAMYGAGVIHKVIVARFEHLTALITDAEVVVAPPADLHRTGRRRFQPPPWGAAAT